MNKKGFISISIVYSFFTVFLLLLLLIVSNIVYNRSILNKVRNEVKSELSNSTFSGYLINKYNKDGEDSSKIKYYAATDKVGNAYRFIGPNPNNYVCLDSKASGNCVDNNHLYRIIGVIDNKVKLIRYNNIATKQIHNETLTNYNFSETDLHHYLNHPEKDKDINGFDVSNFLQLYDIDKYIGLMYSNIWKTNPISSVSDAKTVYETEVTGIKEFESYVSLPYISDYLYAQDGSTNWLNGQYWFLTNQSNDYTYYLNNISVSNYKITNSLGVRPVFFLKSSVQRKSGSGTQADPYRLGGVS